MIRKQHDPLAVLVAIGAIAAICLGVYALLWILWAWVFSQMWPNGPASFTQPGFWPFAGMWLLMTILLKSTRGK